MNDPEEVKALRDELMGHGLLEADIVSNPIDLFKEFIIDFFMEFFII